MKPKRNLLLAASILFAASPIAFAFDGAWTNTVSGNWTNTGNWSGGTYADGSGFTADFSTIDSTADINVNLTADQTIGNLTFGDTNTSSAAGWSIGGSALTLAGTTPTITVGTLGTGKSATITSVVAGTSGLTKAGAGRLILDNVVNTFTGNVTISNGTLRTGSSAGGGTNSYLGAVSGSRAINVGTGATLDVRGNNLLGGGSKTAATINTINIDGGTYSSTRFNIIGNLGLANGAQLVTSTTDSGNYEGFEFIGGTVSVTGTSASTISSTNSTKNHLAGGRTTTFDVADVTSSSAADLTISNGLRNGSGDYSGRGSFTKTGAGTMVLTGSNTATGTVNVNGGTLSITSGGGLYRGGYSGNNADTVINVNSGGTLELQNWGYNETTGSLGGLSANSGRFVINGGTVRMNNTSATSYGRAVTVGASGATLDANGSAKWTIDTVNDSNAWTYNSNPTMTFAGVGTGEFQKVINSGSGTVVKNGTGTWTLSGANTYTGTTTVNDGSLVVSGNSSAATGAVAVTAGSLYVTGQLGGAVTVSSGATVGGDGTIGAISFDGGAKLDISSLTATMNTGNISFTSTGFSIASLIQNGAAIDWTSIVNGTYTLLSGTLDFTNLGNFGASNAYSIGGGREAYFQSGSLQLVVVPESSAALLGGLGALFLLRRRRNG